MIVVIAAMTPMGVIGVNGHIPWHFKADMRRFKEKTLDGTLLVGRKTWQTLPRLKRREVVVLTRNPKDCVDDGKHHPPLFTAALGGTPGSGCNMALFLRWLEGSVGTLFVAGGGEVYRQALLTGLVDAIDLTIVPEDVSESTPSCVTRFPTDLLHRFQLISERANDEEPCLLHRWYERYVES